MYINTMIFTIIAGILSLMLLALLMFGSVMASSYAWLIVTIELGLIVVIVASVVRIALYEKRIKKLAANALDNQMAVKTCPDYWTLVEGQDRKKTCTRSYLTSFGNQSIEYKVEPDSNGQNVIGLSDFENLGVREVCQRAGNLKTPWTDVKAVCDSYNLNTTGA